MKILLVDDEEDLSLLLAKRLEHHGFVVEMAVDGLDCLEKIVNFYPDIILLDIVMPRMDGWEVCKKLRSQPTTKNIPIVFFSALIEPYLQDKVKNAGGNALVQKPFNIESLLQIIKRHSSPTV